jgi:uncharacterized membrane protein YjfL (UPF0719 family)
MSYTLDTDSDVKLPAQKTKLEGAVRIGIWRGSTFVVFILAFWMPQAVPNHFDEHINNIKSSFGNYGYSDF